MVRYLSYPMFQAILAAVLFGISAPLAKLMLGDIEPVPLAAFLYLGSGLSLLAYNSLFYKKNRKSEEAHITKFDLPWLLCAIIAGGVAAPIVLMTSLRYTPAATASLLLNFESVATALLARIVFKEAIGRRIWLAIGTITIASILLSFDISGQWGFSLSALGILSACILWGMDNNFTHNISSKDPLTIVTLKGIGAGGFSLLLALIAKNSFPDPVVIFKAMLLGSVSYGTSIVLFILAMRDLGAARASAFFGTAPFIGAALSFLIFRDLPNSIFFVALPIMGVGTFLILNENHEHIHRHEAFEHEHRHRHDDGHHNHKHDLDETPEEHSHTHIHENLEHNHPHTPDIHHRHIH